MGNNILNDLISRQDAIDALDKRFDSIPMEQTTEILQLRKDLRELPPAQSEITDGQAIEHLRESGWMQNHDKQMYEMGLREQLADDSDSYDALLPPAQPERKKGKWVKIGHWGRSYKCNQCGNYLDFDGVNAGRGSANFCPNCGADMRGEQDG